MTKVEMTALNASDPLAFMAAVGALRIVSLQEPDARLEWVQDGNWSAVLHTAASDDIVEILYAELERWRDGHPAVDFAVGADRKIQDLKHPPPEFRSLMLSLVGDPESAEFVAAYATGVAQDGSGQTKPTSLHFTAGQQRFMDAVLDLRAEVTKDDLQEALFGPWIGRIGPKDTRWRAASERSRALLGFDPGKGKASNVAGAAWLAFLAMPLFPVVPVALRAVTTGFSGRGKREAFTWPIWSVPLTVREVRVVLGLADLSKLEPGDRKARGIAHVLQSDVIRNAQGYGNFAASEPV